MADREMMPAQRRALYHANLEKSRAYSRLSYGRRRERILAYSAARSKTPLGKLVTYRSVAKQQGHSWKLDDRHALDLMTDNCFYCGAAPAPASGIDRVDNTRGYEADNVVSACSMCNIAKNNHSRHKFETWIERAAEHQARWRS